METRENKIQSSEKMCEHRENFIVSFITPVVSSVLHELQNLLSTFGVVRNDCV